MKRHIQFKSTFLAFAGAAIIAVSAIGCKSTSMDTAAVEAKPYPLTTCIMSGEELGDDAVSTVYKGQEVKFCCEKCMAKFNEDPEANISKLNAK